MWGLCSLTHLGHLTLFFSCLCAGIAQSLFLALTSSLSPRSGRSWGFQGAHCPPAWWSSTPHHILNCNQLLSRLSQSGLCVLQASRESLASPWTSLSAPLPAWPISPVDFWMPLTFAFFSPSTALPPSPLCLLSDLASLLPLQPS
jgi:hypothetical protein